MEGERWPCIRAWEACVGKGEVGPAVLVSLGEPMLLPTVGDSGRPPAVLRYDGMDEGAAKGLCDCCG